MSWNRCKYERREHCGREGASPTLRVLRLMPWQFWHCTWSSISDVWRCMPKRERKKYPRSVHHLARLFLTPIHMVSDHQMPATNSKVPTTSTMIGKQSIKVCPLSLLFGETVWSIHWIYTRGVKIFLTTILECLRYFKWTSILWSSRLRSWSVRNIFHSYISRTCECKMTKNTNHWILACMAIWPMSEWLSCFKY